MPPRNAALTIALVLAATAAVAQDAPKIALALLPAPGKPVRFVHHHETRQEAEAMGQTLVTSASTTAELSVEVVGAAEGGGFRAVVRFGRLTGKVSNPLLGEFDLDSEKPLPAGEMERTTAVATLALAGAELGATLDARGAVTKVEGLDAAIQAATARWKLEGLEQTALRAALTEEKVKGTVGWALLVTPLPGPVAVGETWEDVDLVPGTAQGIELRFKTQLAVTKADAAAADVAGKGTVELGGRRGAGATVKESSVAVEARVSRADGLPLSVRETTSVAAVLNSAKGPVPLRQTTKSSLDRVDAWPSAKAPATPDGGAKPR
jgi:hypothetical protein